MRELERGYESWKKIGNPVDGNGMPIMIETLNHEKKKAMYCDSTYGFNQSVKEKV